MMKKSIIASALLAMASASVYAQDTTETKTAPAYGDNPNLITVLAVKAQEKVQNTAERIGAATERGVAKIKPGVDNTWNKTKTFTNEKAELAKENTSKGIDTAVNKVKQTKDNVLGTNTGSVPIERGSLSQSSNVPQAQTQYVTPTQVQSAPVQVNQAVPANSQVIQLPTNTAQNAPNTVEPEITKQSLPIENTAPQKVATNDEISNDVPR